jgi:hypothetical protein
VLLHAGVSVKMISDLLKMFLEAVQPSKKYTLQQSSFIMIECNISQANISLHINVQAFNNATKRPNKCNEVMGMNVRSQTNSQPQRLKRKQSVHFASISTLSKSTSSLFESP